MLKEFIEEGKRYKDSFEKNSGVGVYFIKTDSVPEYLCWLAKIGVFIEENCMKHSAEMTKAALIKIINKSLTKDDYCWLMGYLEQINRMLDEEHSKRQEFEDIVQKYGQ